MLRKVDPMDVQLAKADAVRLDRERSIERLTRMMFNEGEGQDERDRQCRKCWNSALQNAIEVLRQ